MSQKAVADIIGRALANVQFRRKLLTDPNSVLAAYELTQAEVEAIRHGLESGVGVGPAGDLDARISRAGLPLAALSRVLTSAAQDAGAIPEPIPHPAQGPHDTGAIPEPIPHTAHSPKDVGGLPIPIPHEARGPRDTGAIPEPIPHVAQGGATAVSSSPVPQPVSHEAHDIGAIPEPIPHPPREPAAPVPSLSRSLIPPRELATPAPSPSPSLIPPRELATPAPSPSRPLTPP